MSDADEYPRSKVMNILDGVGMLLILASIVLPIMFWSSLPDRIPFDKNSWGDPDKWSGKGIVFFWPVFNTIIFGFFSFLSSVPHNVKQLFTITEENAERQYAIVRIFVTWFKVWFMAVLSGIEWISIQIARGKIPDLERFTAIFVGALIMILATYMVMGFRAR
jgi:uncharacterized membrane protein